MRLVRLLSGTLCIAQKFLLHSQLRREFWFDVRVSKTHLIGCLCVYGGRFGFVNEKSNGTQWADQKENRARVDYDIMCRFNESIEAKNAIFFAYETYWSIYGVRTYQTVNDMNSHFSLLNKANSNREDAAKRNQTQKFRSTKECFSLTLMVKRNKNESIKERKYFFPIHMDEPDYELWYSSLFFSIWMRSVYI